VLVRRLPGRAKGAYLNVSALRILINLTINISLNYIRTDLLRKRVFFFYKLLNVAYVNQVD